MEGIEQGRLVLSGIPCAGPPFSLGLSQGFNRHGRMRARVWAAEGAGKQIHAGMPVVLEVAGEEKRFYFVSVCDKIMEAPAYQAGGREQKYCETGGGSHEQRKLHVHVHCKSSVQGLLEQDCTERSI